jgi:hypothetical protein
VPALKREAVAALVRQMIADGKLTPGETVPPSSVLAKWTRASPMTCRRALRLLVADRTLMPGVSENSRPRVAQGCRPVADKLGEQLSRTFANRRRAAGLTQAELGAKLGASLTTMTHAETGRLWQAREFWDNADLVLGAGGELLRLHGEYVAARDGDPQWEQEEGAPAVRAAPLPVSFAITPGGVLVTWADGSETLAVPPGRQD